MLYWPTTIALAPLLLAQGKLARRRIPVLPEPPGDRAGQQGAGKPLALLITGDSAAAGVGASHQDEALTGRLVADLARDHLVRWRLVARTGATTGSTCAALRAQAPETFDVAVTSLGVNDVTGGITISRWLARQEELWALLRSRFGVRLIVVSGLPPVHAFPGLPQPLRWHLGRRATQLDKVTERTAVSVPDCCFVSLRFPGDPAMMASDGFHPGPPVYSRWAELASQQIREHFKLE